MTIKSDSVSRPAMTREWATASMVAILLIATFLRLTGIHWESIWLDEATSILLAKASIPELVQSTAQDIHPPAYYLLLHFWLLLGENEFAVRAFSAFVGIATVAAIYQMAKSAFDERVGLTAASLLAASPLHIWYSQETRMYALVTLLGLLGAYALWQAMFRHSVEWWAAYVVLMTTALYTHYHAIFVLLALSVYALLLWNRWGRAQFVLRPWIMAQGAIALLFLPWLPVLISQIAGGGGNWITEAIGRPAPRVLIETWIDYSIGNGRAWFPIWLRRGAYVAFALSIVLAARGALARWRQEPLRRGGLGYLFFGLYLVLALASVWVASQIKPMYARRYLLPFLPAYLALVAAGAWEIPWPRWRAALLSVLVGASLFGAGVIAYHPQKDDWRGLADYVMSHAQPRDVVILVPSWNFKPLDYYAQGALDLYADLPVPIPQEGDLSTRLAPALRDKERVWLIWAEGHYGDRDGKVKSYLAEKYPHQVVAEFRGIGPLFLFDLEKELSP